LALKAHVRRICSTGMEV